MYLILVGNIFSTKIEGCSGSINLLQEVNCEKTVKKD